MATYLENTCDFLVHKIRASGLNFSCQETPYSFYITLRKSFTKSRLSQPGFAISESSDLKEKFEKLSARNKILENKSKQLQRDFENLLEDNKAAHELAQNLQTQNDEKDALIDKMESSINSLTSDCNSLEVRNKRCEMELRGRTAECSDHEDTKKLLEKQLEIFESKLLNQNKKAEEEKEKIYVKVKFLQDSVMRSTEETLMMENKLFEARKALKKVKKENSTLKENFENNLKSEEIPAESSSTFLATCKPMIAKNPEPKVVHPSPSKLLEYRKSFPPLTQDLKPFPPSSGLNSAATPQHRNSLQLVYPKDKICGSPEPFYPNAKDTQDDNTQAFDETGRAIKETTHKFGKLFN